MAALRLVTALRYFWRVRGYYAEGIELLRGLLAHPTVAGGTTVRARALNAAGYLEFVRGQQARAGELLEEALSIGRSLGEGPVTAFALRYLCALANARHAYAEARAYGEESLAIYRSLGATTDIAGSSMYLGDIALAQGDDDRAEALYAESAAILRLRRNSIALPYPLRHLGYLALRRGQPERAAALCAESLQLNLAVSDQQGVAACLVGLAASAAALERFEQAARLLGQAEARLEALHSRLLPFDRMQHERARHAVSERLDEAALAAASAAGRAMTIEQLLAEAVPDQAAEPRAANRPPDSLTPPIGREREVGSPTVQQRAVEAAPPTRPTPPHNLPSPLTSFVGRADELSRLTALLASDTRLVTLVGSGGAGKTRLALAIAWQLLPHFAEGVWWVALAGVQPTNDPALGRGTLASAVATALGRTLSGRRDPLDELADTLQGRALLLVLDNCEHLPEIAAVAARCSRPRQRCASSPLRASRSAWAAKRWCGWRGLPVPLPGAGDPASYPGVQLFVERASRHAPGWGEAMAGDAVARLCRMLDGLPLAIELAAHWVGHYTPDEIVEAIQADLDFLAARTRDIPDRHRSLRAVFDYAWRSLNPAEQQSLMRTSVFHGSFDRAAAQAVAHVRATTLVTLADKSLLQQAAIGRYSLHELLRQFAAERLDDRGGHGDARPACRILPGAGGAGGARAGPAGPGGRAGAPGSRARQPARGAQLGVGAGSNRSGAAPGRRAGRFWFTRGYLGEGQEWIERFLPDGRFGRGVAGGARTRHTLRRACSQIRRAIISRRRAGWS
ncbi:MAG: hypothetical protein IPO81_18625 [Kouleothrix sp.]|nr:hypothetical protein [Kouleothrix sp.]